MYDRGGVSHTIRFYEEGLAVNGQGLLVIEPVPCVTFFEIEFLEAGVEAFCFTFG